MADAEKAKKEETQKTLLNEEAAKNTCNKNDRLQKALLVGLVVVNIVLLGVLLDFTIKWKAAREEDRPSEICVPCEDLPDSFLLTHGISENKTTCCDVASVLLDELVKKYTKERFDEDLSLKPLMVSDNCNGGQSVPQKPAARVAGVTMTSADDASSHHLVHWDHNSSLSFVKQGVHYEKGHLRADKGGYYYIYSQVKFNDNVTTSASGEAHLPILSHHVFRHDSGSGVQEKLLEGSQSRCQVVSSRDATSYVGAVFQLNKHDKVYVKVSHREAVAPSDRSNFFGIHLV